MGDGEYLAINEVVDRLREAGYPDSESTVRRMVDDGQLRSYRTKESGGHRRVAAESVEALIVRRRMEAGAASAPTESEDPDVAG